MIFGAVVTLQDGLYVSGGAIGRVQRVASSPDDRSRRRGVPVGGVGDQARQWMTLQCLLAVYNVVSRV